MTRKGSAKSSRSRRLLFALLYIIVVLLLFEGAARLALALLDKTWEPVVPPRVGQFDPMLGWRNRPDTCASSKRTGREVQYCINSKGLRDEETPYEKPADTFRIVALGDSRVFGFGVPVEQHFTRILEGYFKNLEVLNLGVDGYGVGQELLLLRQEGFKYQPDLVIAYVAHYRERRHMKTTVWGVAKPRFVFAGEGVRQTLALENQPVQNSDKLYRTLLSLDRQLAAVSKLYKILRDVGVRIGENIVVAREEEPEKADSGKEAREYDELTNTLAEAIVLQMAEDCEKRGVQFVLVTAIQRLYKRLQMAGVPVLNITLALDSETYPLPDGLGHFNEAGNGAFAWELASFLKKYQLVPESHIPDRPPFNHMDERSRHKAHQDEERMDVTH